jgi:hypothetical protein
MFNQTHVRLREMAIMFSLHDEQQVTTWFLIYEVIEDPWKITSIHHQGHNIGINTFIKIRSDNKLKYLKGIVYHGGCHFVLLAVGKDHTVWFHDEQLSKNCIYGEESLKNSQRIQ